MADRRVTPEWIFTPVPCHCHKNTLSRPSPMTEQKNPNVNRKTPVPPRSCSFLAEVVFCHSVLNVLGDTLSALGTHN